MRILLVDDDESIAKAIRTVLLKESYVVDVAIDGEVAWQLIETFTYDLILLDVLLPKLDGLALCRQLRSQDDQTPVLLITAQNSSSDRVAGLDAGADDYLVKPFEVPELLARMRVLLRRSSCPVVPLLVWEQLRLNPGSREVNYSDRALHLTPKEYRLLELFLRNPYHVFSRNRILEQLWNCEEIPGEDTVTAHIKGLRQKLKKAGAPSHLIETVYGIGYRLKRFSSTHPVASTAHQSTAPTTSAEPEIEEASNNHSVKPPKLRKEKLQEALKVQQTQAALDKVWEKFKGRNRDRLRTLNRAVDAWKQNHLDDDLRQQGIWAAHKLAGALGIFGLTQSSYIALQLEQNFKEKQTLDSQQLSHLVKLLSSLEAMIQQGPPARPSQRFKVRGCPLLLVNDDDTLISEIVRVAQQRQLIAKPIADLRSLQEEMTSLNAAQNSATQKVIAQLPDALVLKFPSATPIKDSLAVLTKLTQSFPHAPVLLLSDQASLDLRIQLAKAGICAVLPKLPPEPVVSLIVRMQFRLGVSFHKTLNQPLPARVLVVDDDPQMLMVMRALLEPWGFQLTTLEHPPKFWDTLETVSPDLLILDVEMPPFNGIELCQVVRNVPRWSQLPVLFLTVHTDSNTVRQALAAGANDLIDKSIAEFEVVSRVLNQVARVRLSQSLMQ
jgi:DNA-binding response OmpR family regulator